MTPKRHESKETALNSAKQYNTTAVVIITPLDDQPTDITYMTFRNISNSGNLREDFPMVLDDEQQIELLQ